MKTVKGPFTVEMRPLDLEDVPNHESKLARLSLDKVYSGALAAVGKGQMLAAHTAVEASAGYVAIEHVDGTLDGKKGTFVVQHSGTMAPGRSDLSITVVPDSGTDELVGLSGSMEIEREDGHHYIFSYSFD